MPKDPRDPAILNDTMGDDYRESHITADQINMLGRVLKQWGLREQYAVVPERLYANHSTDGHFYPYRYVLLEEKVFCPHCKQQIRKNNKPQWIVLIKSDNYLELLGYIEALAGDKIEQKELL